MCGPVAWGNLPPASPPDGDEELNRDPSTLVTRLAIAERQAGRNAAGDGASGDAGNTGGGERAARAPEAVDRLALDLLMKRTADVRLGMPATLRGQMAALEAFSKLSIEEQRVVVPELIELLHNRSPMESSGAGSGNGLLEIRHRANLALSKIAKVYFGQFPVRPAEAQVANDQADRRTTDELIARWTAWWAEAAPLGADDRVALSKRLRTGNYERSDTAAFLVNVEFAVAQKDATPTMLVARRLSEENLKEVAGGESERLMQLMGELCALPDAPPEGLLALLNLVVAASPVELRAGWNYHAVWMRLQSAGSVLQNTLGVGSDWLGNRMVEGPEGAAPRQELFIHPEAIEAWEAAICQRIAKKFGLKETVESAAPPKDEPLDETDGGDEVDE